MNRTALSKPLSITGCDQSSGRGLRESLTASCHSLQSRRTEREKKVERRDRQGKERDRWRGEEGWMEGRGGGKSRIGRVDGWRGARCVDEREMMSLFQLHTYECTYL